MRPRPPRPEPSRRLVAEAEVLDVDAAFRGCGHGAHPFFHGMTMWPMPRIAALDASPRTPMQVIPERDIGVLHQRIGFPGEVTDAELPEIISAAISETHATPMPTVRPVKMFGSDAGKIDLAENRPLPWRQGTARRAPAPDPPVVIPCSVLIRIGKNEPRNVMKIDAFLVRRPQHDRHRHPGDGRDRAPHLGDRKDDLARKT